MFVTSHMLYVKLGCKLFFCMWCINDFRAILKRMDSATSQRERETVLYCCSTSLLNPKTERLFSKILMDEWMLNLLLTEHAFSIWLLFLLSQHLRVFFCERIHQWGKVIEEAFTLWALLGIEHIKEGWASSQGRGLLFSYCRQKYRPKSAHWWSVTVLSRNDKTIFILPVGHCLQATVCQSVNSFH